MTEEKEGVKMEWTFSPRFSCPGCGQTGGRALYSRHVEPRVTPHIMFDFYICPLCGIAFQDPIMTEDTLDQFYAMEYRTLTGRGKRDGLLPADIVLEKNRGERIYKSVCDFDAQRPEYDQILGTACCWLDVGCATGELITKLAQDSWISEGVEPNEVTRNIAQNKGLNVYPSLEHVEERYDVVSSLHVLEHVRDPHTFLLGLRSKLRNCGLLVIDVPHIYGLQMRACAFPHLQVYSVPSLVKQVQRAGFTVLATREVPDPNIPPLYSDITLIAEVDLEYNGSESEPASAEPTPEGGSNDQ